MLSFFVLSISVFLSFHALFTLVWMLYSWNDPDYLESQGAPKEYLSPKFTFTALLPARNEARVIEQTVMAINSINYPSQMVELLVLVRYDDLETLSAVQNAINKSGNPNIKLIQINTTLINKPASLNQGLIYAKGDIISVFDAEDEPHRDIYNTINTLMVSENVDVIQGGVQLMNYNSKWFSPLNVMEYFYWFKSGLHFFTKFAGVTPLGGNTVFFKRAFLERIHGWDEYCLTEDAEIGIRLVAEGAKVRVFYDTNQATQEETPTQTSAFIKQRTRWNQGFLQIFSKGNWLKLPSFKQKLLMMYILISPEIQAVMFIYSIVGVWIAFTQKLPIATALISFLPFYLFLLQFFIQLVGIFEFAKSYKKSGAFFASIMLIISYIPYNILLLTSAGRALIRFFVNNNSWEKTDHINAHRQAIEVSSYAQ